MASVTLPGKRRTKPQYEDDASCGELDRPIMNLIHENINHLDTRSIRNQLVTYQDLYKDCWPERPSGNSQCSGVDSAIYARLANLSRDADRR